MDKWYKWINEVLSSVGIILGIDISTTKDVLGLILIIGNIIVLIISLVIKIIDWVRRSKADGKITADEVKEGLDIISSGIDEINKTIEDSKSSEKENKNE